MLKIILTVVLLALLAGGLVGGYFLLDLAHFSRKPQPVIEVEEQVAKEDPSKAIWASLQQSIGNAPASDLVELQNFLANHPESTVRAEVLDRLNETSARWLFTSVPAEWKERYTVVSGDSLDRISRRSSVPSDWIIKANNLLSHDLQIGQELLLPKLQPRVVLSLSEQRLYVFQDDRLLFAYEVFIPEDGAPSRAEGTVTDRLATKDGRAVAVATAEYPNAAKTISVDIPGVQFAAKPDPASDGETPATPRGILLSPPDMEELFLLVTRGTPVLIQ